ncbi:MAG: transcriptional repressor [Fibromonadales bacterium]|nr:transcriptional repressor [Fibromonadales bacterium]
MNLDNAIKIYKDFLKSKSLLYTQPREIVLKEAFSATWHFSADELTSQMHKQGMNISRATVYRTLASMKKAGILNSVDFGHGHIHYEAPKTKKQHEHITCEKCGEVYEIQVENLENTINSAAEKAKFKHIKYAIRISGICEKCKF